MECFCLGDGDELDEVDEAEEYEAFCGLYSIFGWNSYS